MDTLDYLNRYTSIPYLIDALRAKRLTLRTPDSWEDRNDSHYLKRYKDEKKLATLLALCFMTSRERLHHWKCFADGASGVCIEFRRGKLLKGLAVKRGFRMDKVQYKYVDTLEEAMPPLDAWPFLKRVPFQDEKEFRVIYETMDPEDKTNELPFALSDIRRITLSPWLAKPVAKSIVAVIRALPGCGGLKVTSSTLLENARWRKAIAPANSSSRPTRSST